MERLVLAIIRNEGLISLITVDEVFERAVALYNAEKNMSKNSEGMLNSFKENIGAQEPPQNGLDMIQWLHKFPKLIEKQLKIVLNDFKADQSSTPGQNPTPGQAIPSLNMSKMQSWQSLQNQDQQSFRSDSSSLAQSVHLTDGRSPLQPQDQRYQRNQPGRLQKADTFYNPEMNQSFIDIPAQQRRQTIATEQINTSRNQNQIDQMSYRSVRGQQQQEDQEDIWDVSGPNSTKNQEDIKMIKDALEVLKLGKKVMDKQYARKCLSNHITNNCSDNDKRAREILNQLLLKNPTALDLKSDKPIKDHLHPLDVLYMIYLSVSDEVREMIAESLIASNRAFPFVLPFFQKPQIVAWQTFNLKKEWRLGVTSDMIRNERVYKYRMPIVSFVKLGKNFRCSKSEIINRALFPGANRVFSEIAFTHGMQQKNLSLGMIDVAFAGPELTDTEDKKPDLPDLITVMNLHGDANDEKLKDQFEFIKRVSQLIVIIPEDSQQLQTAGFTINNPPIFVVHDLEEENIDSNFQNPADSFSFLKPNRQMLGNQQFKAVRNKIGEMIVKFRPQDTWKSLEEIAEAESDLLVDFKDDQLKDAKRDAENLFGDMTAFIKIEQLKKFFDKNEDFAKAHLLKYHFKDNLEGITIEDVMEKYKKSFIETIRNDFKDNMTQSKFEDIIKKFEDVKEITGSSMTLGGSRNKILRLQDKELCAKYSRLFKEQNREKDMSKADEIQKECSKIKETIETIIKEEYHNLKCQNEEHTWSFVERFIKILSKSATANIKIRMTRFLDYFGYLIDSTNEEENYLLRDEQSLLNKEITELEKQSKDSDDIKKIQELHEKEEKLQHRINTESFGREHFFREIGLVYNFASDQLRNQAMMKSYLQVVADLMLQGYAIELMDGDNSFIWLDWIQIILLNLKLKINQFIGTKNNYNPKGIAISIMGLQSSGKSTMLNCMFNSKFAVAAGRCTKGIYMLPVILDEKLRRDFKFDYVLIFDTEGLRAAELGMNEDNRIKDNEMATTSVSVADVTLVNSMRMQNTELYELLGVVATAILNYQKQDINKKDSFKVSTIFCNQGIEPSKRSALEFGIRIRENYLNEMAKIAAERIGHPASYYSTLTFSSLMTQNIDEQFIPPLFSDSGNRKRVAMGYIGSSHNIRHCILEKNKNSAGSIDRLIKKITDVFNCIVVDDYTFSFKNNMEMKAINMAQKWIDDQKVTIIDTIRKNIREDVQGESVKKGQDPAKIDFRIRLEEIQNKFKKAYKEWFQDEKVKMPELGQQEDSFLDKLYKFIDEDFQREKMSQLQFSKKRRQNEEQEKEFEQWRKQIRKEMIKIKQEEKKLPPFDEFFENKIAQLIADFNKSNQASQTIEQLYQQSFMDYFKEQRDGLDQGLKDYMKAKEAQKQFTFNDLVPLSIEITMGYEMTDEERKQQQIQEDARNRFYKVLLGAHQLGGQDEKNLEGDNQEKTLIQLYEQFRDEEMKQDEQITLNENFFREVIEKFTSQIRHSLKFTSQGLVLNEFWPWITDSILRPQLPDLTEYYNNKFEKKLKSFLERCAGEEIKISVKRDYDSVLKGLSIEDEIFQLLKEEFQRFCFQVTKDPILSMNEQKLLLEQKLISFLASNVGKRKAIAETKRDCIYVVMNSILQRAKTSDRLDAKLQEATFDQIRKMFSDRYPELIEDIFKDRLKEQFLKKAELTDKTLKHDGNAIDFSPEANFCSIELIRSYFYIWQNNLFKHINNVTSGSTKNFTSGSKDDEAQKAQAEEAQKALNGIVDRIKGVDDAFISHADFDQFKFENKSTLIVTIGRAIDEKSMDRVDDVIRAIKNAEIQLFICLNEIADKLKPFPIEDQKEFARFYYKTETFIQGCNQICPICQTMCTEIGEHHIHKSDMHMFPAMKGFTENDGEKIGLANNVRTCQNMVFYKQTISFEKQAPIPSEMLFTDKQWLVQPAAKIYTEDQAAFGAWAIARYKKDFENNFKTIKKWVNEDIFRPSEEQKNFTLAEKFIGEKISDYIEGNDNSI